MQGNQEMGINERRLPLMSKH